jgi:hypothetical protein
LNYTHETKRTQELFAIIFRREWPPCQAT